MKTILSKTKVQAGQTYGRWTVQGQSFRVALASCDKPHCVVKCECGKVDVIQTASLRSGHSQSCGCLRGDMLGATNTTHGLTDSLIYSVWKSMRWRCRPDGDKNYGVRGIRVCKEWEDAAAFISWALANGYRQGLELDRKDNDKDYEPDNCRFVTRPVNQRNKRTNCIITAFGETKTLIEWSEDKRCQVSYATLQQRITVYGWDGERAITTMSRLS